MINKIKIFSVNFEGAQQKQNKRLNISQSMPDEFVKSSKPLSFKGGYLDYVRVSKNYFRGKKPDAITLEALKMEGVNTIIDLTGGIESSLKRKIKELSMDYHNISLEESINPTEAQVKLFRQIVSNPNVSAYVHCREGRNRTGIMTAIYDVCERGSNFRSAFANMLDKGYDFVHYPNMGEFLESVCIRNGEDPLAIKQAATELKSNPRYIRKLSEYYGIDLSK